LDYRITAILSSVSSCGPLDHHLLDGLGERRSVCPAFADRFEILELQAVEFEQVFFPICGKIIAVGFLNLIASRSDLRRLAGEIRLDVIPNVSDIDLLSFVRPSEVVSRFRLIFFVRQTRDQGCTCLSDPSRRGSMRTF